MSRCRGVRLRIDRQTMQTNPRYGRVLKLSFRPLDAGTRNAKSSGYDISGEPPHPFVSGGDVRRGPPDGGYYNGEQLS